MIKMPPVVSPLATPSASSPAGGTNGSAQAVGPQGRSFMDHLQSSIEELNKEQISADAAARDVAIGKSEAIHETMLALSEAEVNFKMMVQVRNKVLEAYQEVMRMQV